MFNNRRAASKAERLQEQRVEQPEAQSDNTWNPAQDVCPPWFRERLLKRFRTDLNCRLESLLGQQTYLELPKIFSPTDVSRPHSFREKIVEYSLEQNGAAARITEQSIIRIFNRPDINRRLVLLGKPGSGKTACLLQVLDHLLTEAEKDLSAPLPVVFECSEWNGKKILSWMAQQLSLHYDMNESRARKLVQEKLLFPLFDGLDELMGSQQENFIEAFNSYQNGRSMLLCCRIDEYQCFSKKIVLNNALVLQDFSQEKLKQYLLRENHYELWQLLQVKKSLMQLARRPLFLGIMLTLEKDHLLTHNTGLKNREDAEQFLWRLYLDCNLKETVPEWVRSLGSYREKYVATRSACWIRCLAGHMTSDRTVEFRVEELQPTWLYERWKFKTAYGLFLGMIYGMIGAFVFGLLFKPFFGVTYGVAACLAFASSIWLIDAYKRALSLLFLLHLVILSGLAFKVAGEQRGVPFFGLANALDGGNMLTTLIYALVIGAITGLFLGLTSGSLNTLKQIAIIGRIKWGTLPYTFQNLKHFCTGLFSGICIMVVLGMIFGLHLALALKSPRIELSAGLAFGLTAGLAFGLAAGFAFGIPYGLKRLENPSEITVFSGQSLLYSMRKSLLLTPLFITGSMIIFVKVICWAEQLPCVDPVLHSLLFHMPFFYAVCLALSAGCSASLGMDIVLGHYIVRLLLWQEGQLPFRLALWLEALHRQKLLERVGGSYRFIHKRLQEYLANEQRVSAHERF